MGEIDKLLEHVTANCDQIIDSIKQDKTGDADPDEINTDSMSSDDILKMMDEAREIDDSIMEMIADGEIELYRNEDNVVMMKLTELGLKRHEEDQQNEQ